MGISFGGDWQGANPTFSPGQKLNLLPLKTKPVSNLE
jgi:hypothetical protein